MEKGSARENEKVDLVACVGRSVRRVDESIVLHCDTCPLEEEEEEEEEEECLNDLLLFIDRKVKLTCQDMIPLDTLYLASLVFLVLFAFLSKSNRHHFVSTNYSHYNGQKDKRKKEASRWMMR